LVIVAEYVVAVFTTAVVGVTDPAVRSGMLQGDVVNETLFPYAVPTMFLA
jgi:hypothetical protein